MTPKEHEDSQKDLEGKFEGIGAQLGLKDNQIMIIAPLKDSPAEKAGVKRGDIITEVDGQSTQGWTLRDAVNDIRGEGGTEVILTVYRNGDEIEIPITRDEIKVSSVELSYESYEDSGQIAYLKLNQFGESTNAEWNEAVKQIKSKWEGGEIKGMVLDVRDNPGGYLDSSVYIASEFVEKGKLIVKQESLQDDIEYKSRRRGRLLDIPLVVLINQGSASASEILSGALRDHDRAKLVGMKSFGKGSVQEDVNLDKNAGLRVTVAKWVLPGGDWIHEKGIEPDLEVENEFDGENTITKETDKQLKKALEEVSK
jgi:carboxyl-terminal processing protease